MRQTITAILSENSNISSMRLMSFLSLLCGCGIGITGIVRDRDLSQVAILCSVFVGAAFGGKVMQKSIEAKSEQP